MQLSREAIIEGRFANFAQNFLENYNKV
ncbi:MAG: queuine tRNA-ribosyltransferase family protein [Anaerolineae bacterium]|nr:queuine tRNA-ribosyltransferase family protein [Anaerolineae bacterium]